jgi:hypothetical protein
MCCGEAWRGNVCEGINCIQVTDIDIVPGQLFFVSSLIWRHCEACFQADGTQFEQLLWLCTVQSVSQLARPHHTNTKYSRRSNSEATNKKMLQREEISFFRCNKKINWRFMFRRIVSILWNLEVTIGKLKVCNSETVARAASIIRRPDDGGSTYLLSVCLLKRDYTALYPRRL